jgi:hypothetical protein
MGQGADAMSRRDEYGGEGQTGTAASNNELSSAPPDEEVTEIRESIEQTRAGMNETIDQLQERLSPSYLKEQVKEEIREQYRQAKESVRAATIGKVEDMVERVSGSVYETRRSIVDTITANPVPAGLVGIGLAWLWMNRRSDAGRGRYGYPDRYASPYRYDDAGRRYTARGATKSMRQAAGESWDGDGGNSNFASDAGDAITGVTDQVRETASRLADKAKDTVTGAVDQAQQKAGYVVDQAQYQARRVEQRLGAAIQDNPLAVGAVALALGTALGVAMPQTRKENEWMGEARDTFVEKAQSVASEAMEKVQEVAQQVSGEVQPSGSNRSQSHQAGSI